MTASELIKISGTATHKIAQCGLNGKMALVIRSVVVEDIQKLGSVILLPLQQIVPDPTRWKI